MQRLRRRSPFSFATTPSTPSTIPTWHAASSGAVEVAANYTQLLGTHSVNQFIYHVGQQVTNGMNGSGFVDDWVSGTVTASINNNNGAAQQWIDQPFTTATAQTRIDRIFLCGFPQGLGKDITISLQTDSGGNPSGILAGTSIANPITVPLEFWSLGGNGLYVSGSGASSTTYTATTVTDAKGTFPAYGGSTTGIAPVSLPFGWLLVNYTDTAWSVCTVSATGPTAALGNTTWNNYTTGSAIATPANMNTHAYHAFPVLSIPLFVSGLTAATKYHIIISGTTDSTNFLRMAATASVAGQVTQTSSSGNVGTWAATTQTLCFGVCGLSGPALQPGNQLRHTIEDNGARWTGIQYILVDQARVSNGPWIVREYNGALRSMRIVTYTDNTATGALSSGAFLNIQ